jgi:hypothetical protein
LSALALIYPGIATVSEASLIAGPIYAVAGMIQWYVLLPKMFRNPAEAEIPQVKFNVE